MAFWRVLDQRVMPGSSREWTARPGPALALWRPRPKRARCRAGPRRVVQCAMRTAPRSPHFGTHPVVVVLRRSSLLWLSGSPQDATPLTWAVARSVPPRPAAEASN